jgi:hypothetical protein
MHLSAVSFLKTCEVDDDVYGFYGVAVAHTWVISQIHIRRRGPDRAWTQLKGTVVQRVVARTVDKNIGWSTRTVGRDHGSTGTTHNTISPVQYVFSVQYYSYYQFSYRWLKHRPAGLNFGVTIRRITGNRSLLGCTETPLAPQGTKVHARSWVPPWYAHGTSTQAGGSCRAASGRP